jgi:preprotein translocase subunit SecF
VGYSVNDTIVVFDRVRENLKTRRRDDFETVLNDSINQTLSRTILTSGLTFLTVIALFIFGGEIINNFAFAMVIGIIVGTYSSVAVAAPLVLVYTNLMRPKLAVNRR